MIAVLQVLPTLRSGGVERGVVELSQYLAQHGCGTYICSGGGPLVGSVCDDDSGNKVGAVIHHIQLNVYSKNPLMILRNAFALYQIVKRYNINIIHARSRAPAWSCYIAAKLSKVSYITTFHGIYSLRGGWLKRFYNCIMTKGERVIAVSQYVKEHIVQNYHLDDSRIEVIDRWVDLDYFDPSKVDLTIVNEMERTLHKKKNSKLIVVPARLTWWKGQEYFLEVLSVLDDEFSCVFIGKAEKGSSYVQRLRQKIFSYNLEDNVRIISETDHMRELYYTADFIAVPSVRPEAFGRVVIEAQAMKKVVISTNIGAQKYNVEHNVTGFQMPYDNVEEAAKVLHLALNHKNLANIKQQAHNFAVHNFSMQQKCAQILEIYNCIVGQKT